MVNIKINILRCTVSKILKFVQKLTNLQGTVWQLLLEMHYFRCSRDLVWIVALLSVTLTGRNISELNAAKCRACSMCRLVHFLRLYVWYSAERSKTKNKINTKLHFSPSCTSGRTGELRQMSYSCVVTNLYNELYTVNTQQYISTVILYIHSGHITAIMWPECIYNIRP